jgi:hypothetical protein
MMRTPVLKAMLMAGMALSPLPAIAQQIDSEWSPMEDAYGSGEEAVPKDRVSRLCLIWRCSRFWSLT